MKLKHCKLMLVLMTLALGLSQTQVQAADSDQAKVLKIDGQASYMKAGGSEWSPLAEGMMLAEGDGIKTPEKSEVILELAGAQKTAEVVVRENTEFIFKNFNHDKASLVDTTLLDVSLGAVLVKAEKLVGTSKFEVKTPTSIVGIRGTTFEVQVAK